MFNLFSNINIKFDFLYEPTDVCLMISDKKGDYAPKEILNHYVTSFGKCLYNVDDIDDLIGQGKTFENYVSFFDFLLKKEYPITLYMDELNCLKLFAKYYKIMLPHGTVDSYYNLYRTAVNFAKFCNPYYSTFMGKNDDKAMDKTLKIKDVTPVSKQTFQEILYSRSPEAFVDEQQEMLFKSKSNISLLISSYLHDNNNPIAKETSDYIISEFKDAWFLSMIDVKRNIFGGVYGLDSVYPELVIDPEKDSPEDVIKQMPQFSFLLDNQLTTEKCFNEYDPNVIIDFYYDFYFRMNYLNGDVAKKEVDLLKKPDLIGMDVLIFDMESYLDLTAFNSESLRNKSNYYLLCLIYDKYKQGKSLKEYSLF